MTEGPPRHAPEVPPPEHAPSVVVVNTGDGKGKTTAAMGTVLRAVARGWRVLVVQFVKSDRWRSGEEEMARRVGVDWWTTGDGFSWEVDDIGASEALARDAWAAARRAVEAGEHDLVVLDEVTYPMTWGWIPTEEVVDALRSRPEHVNIVATGRDAPPELVAAADTATEMRKVKHAYDRGIRARRGIDF